MRPSYGLRTGVMAGSPCPIEVMRAAQSRIGMREVTICYGMTEIAIAELGLGDAARIRTA